MARTPKARPLEGASVPHVHRARTLQRRGALERKVEEGFKNDCKLETRRRRLENRRSSS